MMDQVTNCGVMLDTESKDERLRGKRGTCRKDYEMLRGLQAVGALKWQEAVGLGFCKGTKEAEKKVLRAVLAYRQQMEIN